MDPGGQNRRQRQGEYYHARYRKTADNLFFQIQQLPVPDQGVDEPSNDMSHKPYDLTPLYTQMRSPSSDIIQDFECPYVHLFLEKLPVNMGIGYLFPSVFGTIFAHAMSNDGLRFMILAVSSLLADNMARRPPLHAYRYLQMAIPQIQQALTNSFIDDALVYSVFLAAYLHLICGELASARRHLEGLRLLLQRYHASPEELQPNMPPELMLIWRMAIRMDHLWAIGDQEAIFPAVAKQDGIRRRWVQRLVDYSHPELGDWALAQFALDDLLSRAIAINRRAIQLRSSSGYDVQLSENAIRNESQKLLEEHQAWNERPCVKAATEQYERERNFVEENKLQWFEEETLPFLHYPPLKIDKNFGAIRIQYFWVLIYITFITDPQPGVYPFERFQAAINFCRTYAAVRWTQTCGLCRVIIGLYLSGLTLGEPSYPAGKGAAELLLTIEFGWIAERLEEIDRVCGLRAGLPVLNILRTTWRSEGSHWSHYRAGHNR